MIGITIDGIGYAVISDVHHCKNIGTSDRLFDCLLYTSVWRHRGGGGEGTTIQSTKAHPLPEAVYYLQKDEEWAAAPLGESRFTMGSSGCLVTCLATLFDLYGESVTPGELNRLFTEPVSYTHLDVYKRQALR